MNLSLLPSYWGFSFDLGHGVSPPSWSSAVQSQLQHLLSYWDLSDLGRGVSSHGCSSAVQLQLYILIIIYCNRAGLAVLCCKQVPGSPLSFIFQSAWLPLSRLLHVSNDYRSSSCHFCIPVRRRYISVYRACACVLSHFNCAQLFVTLWTIVLQAPLSIGFSRLSS